MDASRKAYIHSLKAKLSQVESPKQLLEAVVNAPFEDELQTTLLDLGIIVLLSVNKKSRTIDRIALSNTGHAKRAEKVSAKPFRSIKIPLDNPENVIAESLRKNKPYQTEDWYYLFVPALNEKQARLNQANAGIECSLVCPLSARDGGALIFSFYQPLDTLTKEHYAFVKSYAKLVDKVLSN